MNGQFEKSFHEAIDRTQRLGLGKVAYPKYFKQRYLTTEALSEIPSVVYECIGLLDDEKVVGQCLSVHYRLKQALSDYFKTDLFFTIGFIGLNGKFFFNKQRSLSSKCFSQDSLGLKLKSMHG